MNDDAACGTGPEARPSAPPLPQPPPDSVLAAVGPRLRALRHARGLTLAQLGAATGISSSTLSRLESGGRRPTLELLLPLAGAYGVPLDDLVGAPPTGDPRVHLRPLASRHGVVFVPLTRQLRGLRAFKQIVPGTRPDAPAPELFTHEGYEWVYVLAGRLRLRLGDHDLVLGPGEAAEFDTRTPHSLTAAGAEPVELLSLFGPQGERLHVRVRPSGERG
jgi:transcriptional regulator with XRE-family HTH domain